LQPRLPAAALAEQAATDTNAPAAMADTVLRTDGNAGSEAVAPAAEAVAAKVANGSRPARAPRRR